MGVCVEGGLDTVDLLSAERGVARRVPASLVAPRLTMDGRLDSKGMSMSYMPENPREFAAEVRSILERIKPSLEVEMQGTSELIVDGRRLDLENLHRLVATDEERGVEIVEQYLDHLFDEETFGVSNMPWELAQARLMPRIQPEAIFEHLSRDLVAHVPFVNDTVIVFVIDLPKIQQESRP